jgi:integrase/recombinase XerD
MALSLVQTRGLHVREILGLRDRAIMEVFYSTGMRRMELCHLQVYDLNTDKRTVLIRQAKGKKDRVLPIGERAVAWTVHYLEHVRLELMTAVHHTTLFVTRDGLPFSTQRLSDLVRRYVRKAELSKTGGCHLFRHSMATSMLENGADIRYIQAMLGHASLETTEIYTRVSIQKLRQIHDATHPASRKHDAGDEDAEAKDEQPSDDGGPPS